MGHLKRSCRIAVTAMAALMLLTSASAAAEPPPFLTQICKSGSGPGQCLGPTDVATDPSTGNVYVMDYGNSRIDEFTAWGEFIRAFGGGVVNGGAAGMGTLSPGSTAVTDLSVSSKEFVAGMPIEGVGLAPGTTVMEVSGVQITLSKPATQAAAGQPTELSSPEAPNNVPTNELQRITVTATNGSYRLTFSSFNSKSETTKTTGNIPYNAAASVVRSELEGLSNIGAGNITVTSANPGGEAGIPGGPYLVEFSGASFTDTNVNAIRASEGSPAPTNGRVNVRDVRNGGGAFEVCTGLDCRQGIEGHGPGQFSDNDGIAVDAQGNVYVAESSHSYGQSCWHGECEFDFSGSNNRVQKFDSEGNFLLMFGGDVDEGGGVPAHPGNLCTAEYIAAGDACGGGRRGKGNGEFGVGAPSNFNEITSPGPGIAIGPTGTIYVGGFERIQEFNPNGSFKGLFPDPEGVLTGEEVKGLTVDSVGDIYAVFSKDLNFSKEGIRKLSPAGKLLATLPARSPRALAVDPTGDLYAGDGPVEAHEFQVLGFSPDGSALPNFPFEPGPIRSFGMATSSSCGIQGVDIYLADGVRASTSGGISAYGPPPDPSVCPPPEVPPAIDAQSVTSVDSDGATVKAKIDPRFWADTSYYVEYGTGKCSEGGCDRQQPAAPGSRLTTQTIAQEISTPGVLLSNLEANTTYHYRFVAQSSGGGPVRGVGGAVGSDGSEGTFTTFPLRAEGRTDCPNQAFRAGGSARLPDCRAYEMVSPVDKNGGDATTYPFVGGLLASSSDGQKLGYAALRSFADPEAAPLYSEYLAARGSDGWSTRSISPPRSNPAFFSPGGSGQYKAFSEDLCSAWILQDSPYPLVPEAPVNAPNLYRQDLCGEGGFQLVTSTAAPGFDFKHEFPETHYLPNPQGHSSDGSLSVFRANAKLTSNACETESEQLYAASEEGPLRLVSILPNGKASCTHSTLGTFWGSDDGFTSSSVYHAVSADGSRIFWTASEAGGPPLGFASGGGRGTLYVRLNPALPPAKPGSGCSEAEKACTLAVSGSPKTFFWGADPQGETAIYSVGSDEDSKLFEFDVATATSHLIAGETFGVAGMSEDASRIYFASSEVLSGEQTNNFDAKASAGKPNLYLYEKGVGFTFIGILGTGDLHGGSINNSVTPSPLSRDPRSRSARVTADGLHFAFSSSASLTGYDNRDLESSVADEEVFIYDADGGSGSGHLACVSCNPSGARPAGRMVIGGQLQVWAAAVLPGWPGQLNPSRLLSSDGSRLFFESYEALVPNDTNGARDVYEWEEAADAADCRALGAEIFVASAGGCLGLISSGQNHVDSELLDASSNGSDVFFSTSASLLPQDLGLVDIYDARVDGGFPSPPGLQPACEGEACQGAPAPPNDPTPASSSFEGAGNVKESVQKKPRKKKHAKKKHIKKPRQQSHTKRASKGRATR